MLRQTTRGGAARASEGWSAASRRPGRHRRERSRLPTAVCALLLVAGIALIGSLVSVDRAPAASSCGAGLPAYFYPFAGGQEWPAVSQLDDASLLVINPASGPGAAVDTNYLDAVRHLGADGPRLYGYVDSAYGSRAVSAVIAESRRHRQWYGVSGIFLDQAALDTQHLDYYGRILDRLHSMGFDVALNPGQPDIDPRYLDLAEHVVTFEGSYGSYERQQFPDWTPGDPDDRIWHLVYDVPTGAAMEHVIARARTHGAGLVYVTDRTMPNPWDGLPAYWHEERRSIAGCR
jgi:Spherulation-specific family 4